ncbi:MAG: hypothetical protein DMG30_05805 [Acidobacteria bacterium]|nr:MAG: hypothetical protein DMG30_05805 [Acidobacteriota bacterium]
MLTLNTTLANFIKTQAMPPFGVLWDLAKQVSKLIPETWDRFSFRRFWGEGILSTDAYFVMDSYENVRLRNNFRNAEPSPASEEPEAFIGTEIVRGCFCPQAAAMLTALFLRHSGKVLRIATDTEPSLKRDSILICYGTPDMNFKTFDIEAWSGSSLCQFLFTASGQRAFRLAGQLHSTEIRGGVVYDKAIVLRLTNRQESNHPHVVCAGLTEWGSLAAVHYLTKNWKELRKRFDSFGQRRDFCVLLEVQCAQFENVRELTSVVWWEPRVSAEPHPGVKPCLIPMRHF